MDLHHITDSDLERYYIGTFDGVELLMLEEHLEWCSPCAERLNTIDRLDSMAPKTSRIRGADFMTQSRSLRIASILVCLSAPLRSAAEVMDRDPDAMLSSTENKPEPVSLWRSDAESD